MITEEPAETILTKWTKLSSSEMKHVGIMCLLKMYNLSLIRRKHIQIEGDSTK